MEQLNTFMEMTGYTGDGWKWGVYAVFIAGIYYISKEQGRSQGDNDTKKDPQKELYRPL